MRQTLGCLPSQGEIMRAMRIVLLIANGVWLPDFAYQGASHVYFYATYPTTDIRKIWHLLSLFANIIPAVVGSLTLVGNIAYIWRSRPHAACRIVLLISNGFWLSIYAVGTPFGVYVLVKHDYPIAEAIATYVVCFFILVGNFAYIWRSWLHAYAHKERDQRIARASPS